MDKHLICFQKLLLILDMFSHTSKSTLIHQNPNQNIRKKNEQTLDMLSKVIFDFRYVFINIQKYIDAPINLS